MTTTKESSLVKTNEKLTRMVGVGLDERVGEGRVSPHQDLVFRASARIVALVQGFDQMEKRRYSYIATRRLLH